MPGRHLPLNASNVINHQVTKKKISRIFSLPLTDCSWKLVQKKQNAAISYQNLIYLAPCTHTNTYLETICTYQHDPEP